MGCDIHFWVEWQKKDGTWEEAGEEGEYYSGRHYYLFAHLAGVRNVWGVAPIAEPRGLPKDLSGAVREYFGHEDDYTGLHDHSWFTLAELLDYAWAEELLFFRDEVLKDINRLTTGTGLTPNDIRIVFAFDN